MPLFVYVVACVATILFTLVGFTLLAVLTAVVAAALVFEPELRRLKLPVIDFWRTDP